MIVPADRVEQLTQEVEQLHMRLGLLEDALENMHHGLCMFDADNRIAVCNRRYSEVLGLSADMVKPGMSAAELIALGVEAGFYDPGMSAEEIERDLWANLRCDDDERATLKRGGRIYAIHPRRTESGNLVATFEDVTSRAAAENALRESEARLSAIMDAIPDCVMIFDEQLRLVQANPAALRLLEAADTETLAGCTEADFPPGYLDGMRDSHRRVMAGEAVIASFEIIGLGGRRSHVDAHSVPIRLPDGTKVQLCIVRDVSERKKAEDALRLSERRLRLVHDATGLAEFEAFPNGTIECSDRLAAQLGLGDARTLTIDEWVAIIHPDDREWVRKKSSTPASRARHSRVSSASGGATPGKRAGFPAAPISNRGPMAAHCAAWARIST